MARHPSHRRTPPCTARGRHLGNRQGFFGVGMRIQTVLLGKLNGSQNALVGVLRRTWLRALLIRVFAKSLYVDVASNESVLDPQQNMSTKNPTMITSPLDRLRSTVMVLSDSLPLTQTVWKGDFKVSKIISIVETLRDRCNSFRTCCARLFFLACCF